MIIEIKKWNLNLNKTALNMAVRNNSVKMVELLISKGADINAKDIIYLNILILFFIKIIWNKLRKLKKKNRTPLHVAAYSNSSKIIEILISKGADINAKDIIYQNIK